MGYQLKVMADFSQACFFFATFRMYYTLSIVIRGKSGILNKLNEREKINLGSFSYIIIKIIIPRKFQRNAT